MGPAPYRMPPQPRSPDPYLLAWQRYGDRRALKWILFFAWPVVAALVVSSTNFRTENGPYYAVLAVALAALAAMSWLGVFDCPRCGARMYVRSTAQSARDPLPDGCRSCGIEVGTPKYPHAEG